MVKLHRLNGTPVFINFELVRWMDASPDSVLTFTDGKTLMVKESMDEILVILQHYKKSILQNIEVRPKEKGQEWI